MQTRIVFIFLLFPFFAFSQVIPASSSAFAKGDWIKMGVVEEGIYKITYADLVQQGINVGSVRPSELKVFGIDWGDLPQNNDSGFSFDPLELAVHIEGENDGIFNEQDYILFYARGPHKFELTSNASVFELGYNHYSDTAYYFLNINSGSASKRVLTQANSWDGLNLLTSYDAGFYYKSEQNSRIMSGRDWYGEYYSASAKSRLYQMPNWVLANNSTVKLAVSLLGYTFEPALFTFKLGGFTLGNLDMSPVIDYRYADKGIIERDTFAIASTLLPPAPQLIIDFSANAGSRISEGYMEHLIYQAERPLITVDTQTKFSSLNSLKSAISSYQITLDKPLTDIWDVTDLQNPASQLFSIQSGKVNFGSESSRLHSFIAFDRNSNNLLKPLSFETVINQNLKDQSPVDLIIITPELFSPQAEELAAFRRQNDGFDVQVTSIEQIYNEFSGGRRDPSAIRNYVRYMYWRDDSPQKLKYVLLFGKGTFDAKNIMGYNNNFIPVYESRNSLNPLNSYGSDDFYTFLDVNEGYWDESAGNEPDMDVAIGRLPVKNQTEAAALVSKIIHYSISKQTLGSWRNEVLFVADDGDFNIHQSQSNQMAMYVDTTFSGVHPKRLFLDNFIQEPRTGGEKSPDMEKALSRSIEEGALIVNFTGHGGPGGWMQEGVLDNSDINNWTNINKLPLFVTATCEFGRHDNPTRISGGELIILKEDGGGIGLVTTSRPVFSSTNFILNKAFYAEVFGKQNNNYKPLGEVFRQTKNNSMNGVFNRNFSLLGDPSMTLNYPGHEVKVTSINSVQPDLIDLQGLSSVTVAGNIVDFSGQLLSGFNGSVDLTFFDKPLSVQTLGNESAKFIYKDWASRLFNGTASVENGEFSFNFILPSNVYTGMDQGKMLFYTQEKGTNADASGSLFKINVGGIDVNATPDTTPPEVNLYMNDFTFRDGGIVPSNSTLIVDIFDESGVGISSAGGLSEHTATLDNLDSWILNDYYQADTNSFKSGKIYFDLNNLSEGKHTIVVKVFDVYTNSKTATVSFIVKNEKDLVLERLHGVPNPFVSQTALSFGHNRPGDDFEIQLQIMSSTGKVIIAEEYLIENSPAVIELFDWNLTTSHLKDIEKGFYIAAIRVKSLTDGVKKTTYCKLICLK